MKLVYLASHPIQYHAPLFRALAKLCDFQAWFAHRQDAAGQAAAGYGVGFDWDVDLLSGYAHRYLDNVATRPGIDRFGGCDSPQVVEWLRALKPDVIVLGGWNLKVYWQALRAARAVGAAVWFRSDSQWRAGEGGWRRLAKRLLYRWPLDLAQGVLCAGTRSREYLRDLGVPGPSIAVVPHAIDVRRFADGIARREETRLQFNFGARGVVGFVGRLIAWKRVDALLRAVAALPAPRPRVLVVGDGPEREPLIALAREVQVDAIFAGFRNQSELPGLYAAMDVFVLPSDARETWGLVANEALAAGCRVLVSAEAGCAPDLAAFSPAVISYDPAHPPALTEALDAAFDDPHGDAVTATRQAALRWFSPEFVAAEIVAVCARGAA